MMATSHGLAIALVKVECLLRLAYALNLGLSQD